MTDLENEHGPAMLSGLTGIGDQMFGALGAPDRRRGLPDPGEMRKNMDDAQHIRHADIKYIEARTYDLSKDADVAQYCKDREWVMVGMAMSTHALLHHEKKFVPDINPPRWIAHMEWVELILTERVVPTITTTKERENEATQ